MKIKLNMAFLCAIFPASTFAQAPQPPHSEISADARPLECWKSDIEIQGHAVLTADCKAGGTIRIHKSDTSLDCNNHTIDLQSQVNNGIIIDSKGTETKNVSITNCTIKSSKQKTIYIGWDANSRKKSDEFSIEDLYKKTPHQVLIKNVNIINSGSSAIYLDDYVSNAILDNINIINPASLAIYFEFSTKNNTLQNSTIQGAGNAGKREAVAIDSSSGNSLIKNKFINNRFGGIFVYRNCSEHYSKDSSQAFRWMSADDNKIEGNEIVGSRYGIWIASRQSVDLKNSNCGLPYYADGRYVVDSAKKNAVIGNKISSAEIGILIEDDDNIVTNNKFTNIKVIPIRVGSRILYQYVGRGIRGTEIQENQWLDSKKDPVLLMWGSKQPPLPQSTREKK
jgi:parallel beta-helix repeat protein